MIKSWHDDDTESVFYRNRPRGLPADPGFLRTAHRKLVQLDRAVQLRDMKSPPGNKLHPLEKDREGQWAIWINSKYRLIWEWRDGDAYRVEIEDYHP